MQPIRFCPAAGESISMVSFEIDSPAAGQNRIGGFSGDVGFESLRFFDVGAFILDTATNDDAAGIDTIHIGGAGMVASGLGTLFLNVGLGFNFVLLEGGTAQLDTNLGVGGVNLNVITHNSAVLNFNASPRLGSLSLSDTAP